MISIQDLYPTHLTLLCTPHNTLSEDSFGCVFETEDSENHRGVRLSKGEKLEIEYEGKEGNGGDDVAGREKEEWREKGGT